MESINGADTAWVLVAASLVMLMTPGLGLFYGGSSGADDNVRQKSGTSLTHLREQLIGGITVADWRAHGQANRARAP